tara:strand:- start:50084 stop:51673 length:1590 start_codon:yes stop_codon:yes gene_type:complete
MAIRVSSVTGGNSSSHVVSGVSGGTSTAAQITVRTIGVSPDSLATVTANFANTTAIAANTAAALALATAQSAFDSANSTAASSNSIPAYDQANAAYNKANSANLLAYTSNVTSLALGAAAFDKANSSNITAGAAFDHANAISVSVNAYAVTVGTSGNTYADLVGTNAGTGANAYATTVGTSSNAYAVVIGSSSNAYSEVLSGAAFDKANSANLLAFTSNVTSLALGAAAFGQANDALTTAGAAFDQANTGGADTLARTWANTANLTANNNLITVGAAFDKANAANLLAFTSNVTSLALGSAAFDQANTSNNIAVGNVVAGTYTVQSTRNRLNFLEGSNITLTIDDDSAGDRANVTIASTGGSASVTVANTAPGAPSEGDLWWNDDTGRLLVYYDDGDSQQFVDASPSNIPGPIGPTGPFGPKSMTIINPTASEDVTLFYTNQSVVVNKISSTIKQSATSNVSFTLRYNADRDATGTEIITGGTYCTSNTLANTVYSFDSATIAANTFLWLETTSITGSVQEFHVTIDFT